MSRDDRELAELRDSLYKGLGAFIGGLVLFVICLFVRGIVIVKLWSWFMVPTFGLVALTIPSALGLSLMIGVLTGEAANSRSGKRSFAKQMLISIFFSLIGLLFGWIYQFFM